MKKRKKTQKKKKDSGGGYYTPCENCGGSKYECSCFKSKDRDNEIDYTDYNDDED